MRSLHGSISCRKAAIALADADLLWQFWQKIHTLYPQDLIDAAMRSFVKRASLPAALPEGTLDALPSTPGIYIFHGDDAPPLYVGKSINLKQHIAFLRRSPARERPVDLAGDQAHRMPGNGRRTRHASARSETRQGPEAAAQPHAQTRIGRVRVAMAARRTGADAAAREPARSVARKPSVRRVRVARESAFVSTSSCRHTSYVTQRSASKNRRAAASAFR